ncbi:thiosulfate reductase [Halarcobacter ebronensis]|uniref:Thiosulfate reductase n=1 Tax=Halarcobacter ebronensis TaxID=1462615 RepID=A0A4Q0YC75_9BACT|nr:molybdopterin-dependent oxidoreductase [Halarcobacter ebronensis]RXJ67967.1 thiosulfate reductase [Halarcobacter ebronensis]
MQVEISRRKFLQGTVALSVVAASTSALSNAKTDEGKKVYGTTKTSSNANDIKIIPTLCEMCVNKCAAYARVENNVVTKLDPNPHFPKSQNMLCARGNAGIQALYDPDRIKYPLIRVGKRGDGKYKRVTWDEAYTYISEKLTKILDEEKDNRSCIGYCAGEGMAEHTFKTFMFDKFGSTNFINHSSICLQTTVSGYALTIGGYGQADLENADYVIMAGANRAEAIVTPDTMELFKRTKGRGAKLVVIDPRFTNTAAHADEWVAIEVGTDLALVLAMTHVVITEELYNKKFVSLNFNGFEEYKQHILSNNYTPQWAEKITGVKVAQIKKMARDFMHYAPKSIYYQGRRSAWSKQDFQLRRAQAIFTALGGGIDKEGGIVFGKTLPLGTHKVNAPMYANAESRIEKNEAAIIGGAGSWIAWRNMIVEGRTPYPIRGMFIYKQNPMLSVPNVAKTRKMFEKMDLVVAIDTMPSDSAIMADVILPECTYLEREDPVKSFGGAQPSIALRQATVKPLWETKPVIEIMQGLSKKLSKPLWEITKKYDEDVQDEIEGMSEDEVEEFYKKSGFDLADAFEHSQKEINRHMVEEVYGKEAWDTLREKGVYYLNMDKYFKKLSANRYEWYPKKRRFYSVVRGEFKADVFHDTCVDEKEIAVLKKDFKTPTGKVECVLENLARKGVDAMPTWRDEMFTAVPKDKFRFITGRHAQFTQNATCNNAMLLDLLPENYLWVNKRVARNRGIEFGDLVEVQSSAGKIQIKAYPTEKIGQNTLFFVHGFGSSSDNLSLAKGNGASDNIIIEDVIEPVFGSAAMHETIVDIRKV